MKILCICEQGNTRSVGLAYILKTLFNQDAIAIGYKKVGEETLATMYNWADKVVIFDENFHILNDEPTKIIRFNVGQDVWWNFKHQELVHRLYRELSKHPELWQK